MSLEFTKNTIANPVLVVLQPSKPEGVPDAHVVEQVQHAVDLAHAREIPVIFVRSIDPKTGVATPDTYMGAYKPELGDKVFNKTGEAAVIVDNSFIGIFRSASAQTGLQLELEDKNYKTIFIVGGDAGKDVRKTAVGIEGDDYVTNTGIRAFVIGDAVAGLTDKALKKLQRDNVQIVDSAVFSGLTEDYYLLEDGSPEMKKYIEFVAGDSLLNVDTNIFLFQTRVAPNEFTVDNNGGPL
jgi:nicotinamidase-related amidase